VRVGDVPEPGRIELDAAGCLVTPGFVDAHVHGDAILFSDRVHLPALHQGVTTYVIGQDGCSFAPGTRETVAHMSDYFAAVNGRLPTRSWSVGEFLAAFDGLSTVNVAYLAPHGNIRLNVVGTARAADAGRARSDAAPSRGSARRRRRRPLQRARLHPEPLRGHRRARRALPAR
jgi:N-acyl-D-aspartate/D-glutamate deacylase